MATSSMHLLEMGHREEKGMIEEVEAKKSLETSQTALTQVNWKNQNRPLINSQ